MKLLHLFILAVVVYFAWRWYHRRQLARLAALAAGAPAAVPVTVYAPSAMSTPTVPTASMTTTDQPPGVTVARDPSLYWSVPSSFIPLYA